MNYPCPDCGKGDHQSVNAMMRCDCDKYDRNGYPRD